MIVKYDKPKVYMNYDGSVRVEVTTYSPPIFGTNPSYIKMFCQLTDEGIPYRANVVGYYEYVDSPGWFARVILHDTLEKRIERACDKLEKRAEKAVNNGKAEYLAVKRFNDLHG